VTASEFVFLAMGLALGLASGAALVEILRARPSPPRQVRLTVAPDAVPRRRAATLADDAFLADTPPAPGGPADHPETGVAQASGAPARTPVLSAASDGAGANGVVAAHDDSEPRLGRVLQPAFRLTGPDGADPETDLTPVAVDSGIDPMLAALRASAAATAVSAMRIGVPTATAEGPPPVALAAASSGQASEPGATSGSATRSPSGSAAASGSKSGSGSGSRGASAGGGSSVGGAKGSPPPADPTGPCADEKRLADERCELAARARTQALAAEDTVRAAQRAYDEHEARANAAAAAADPRAVRRAKDEAQADFRGRRSGATTNEEVEAAAREWLLEVNRINSEARDAAITMGREREAARGVGTSLERVALEAEAARIAAETAEAACLAAREALAVCEERAAGGTPSEASAVPVGAPAADATEVHEEETLALAFGSGRTPRVFRLLRGDRAAMTEILAVLAGDDATDRRRWQLALSDLVDAILADSIEHASLEFPSEHPFWGPFTREQNRDISSALSSLGYRFDGLGGWIDGRVPSQRDLSLAMGYAGLDPMRMRQWPTERDMAQLYAEVTVAADEHLAGRAGDLTLGELVTMLGRRADGLAEVWNAWGRLRPLLLEEV
jgi:hypothetical protein